MTHPLRMHGCLPIAAAIVVALLLPATASAADWSAVSEPPLTDPPFASDNVGITDSPGGNYAPSTTYEALSTPVTLPAGYSTCRLSYWRAVDRGAGDTFTIAVLLNGVPLASGTPDNHSARDAFIDLNDSFDPGGQVRVRLRLTTDSNPATVDDGVHMDNFRLVCHGTPSDAGYEFLDGTSMATPMVSGAAGLLFSDDPTLTASDAKDTLLNSVDQVAGLAGTTVTGGRLNAYRALIDDFNPAGVGGGGGGSSAGSGSGGETAGSGSDSTASEDGGDVVPGQVMVRYEPGSSTADRAEARDDTGTETVEGLGMARAQLLSITDGDSVAATVHQLESQPAVDYAEPDQILHPALVPNDTFFGQQWGLFNDGQTVNGVTGTPDADIDANEAWNVSTGLTSTTVAVIDTGADLAHPDLVNNLWTNSGEIPGNGIDDDSDNIVDDVHGADFFDLDGSNNPTGDPTDLSGHGTHVSGIAAAEGNNSLGVSGVSEHAALMELRICGTYDDGCPTSAEVKAINYAGSHGARVLNASLQGSSFSQVAQDALTDNPDMLYVFAAGNGGADGIGDDNDVTPSYPCNLDQVGGYSANNVICVAATDQNDARANFSNYGETSVDLGAPGVDILSTSSEAEFFSDDFEGGDFDLKWGGSGGSSGGGGAENSGSTTTTTTTANTNTHPNTFFKRKPGKVVETDADKARVVFRFGSSEAGSTFKCQLDSVQFVPCPSRYVRRLVPARHVIKVRAVDGNGAQDPSAAVYKFRIERIDG